MGNLSYEIIIKNFVAYVENEDVIRAVIIVGSRARKDKPADEWSDLDLVIFTDDLKVHLHNTQWINEVGKPYITFLEETAVGGSVERRVLFENGLDVDFCFFPSEAFDHLKASNQVLNILKKGTKILVDKDGKLTELKQSTDLNAKNSEVPSKEELNNMMQDFYYHAVLAAKKLRRGEILTGKSICDNYMKHLLVDMIKVQTKLIKGVQFDTWHGFRFFEEWADPSIVQEFKSIYSHYDESDVWKALEGTMRIFDTVANEVCLRANIDYPVESSYYSFELTKLYKETR